MIVPLILTLTIASANGAETTPTASHINQLLAKGTLTIENTKHNLRLDGLRLPVCSLSWPSSRKGDEKFQEIPGKGQGLLLSGKRGSEILAPATGVVKYVGSMGKHTSVVIVDHRQQVQTIFIGLDKNSVTPGQNVYSGQRFARLPAYGPLVHEYFFELRYKGKAINPMPFMKRRG